MEWPTTLETVMRHRYTSILRNAFRPRRSVVVVAERSPCFIAFIRDLALPSSLRGPVDRSHGFTRCAAARSDASPAGVSR